MYNKKSWYLVLVIIFVVIIMGCTTANQDEEYKSLVIDSLTNLDPINEHIINPYRGITVEELTKMRTFSEKAKYLAEQMILSDNSKKSRDFFINAMDKMISGIKTLESKVDISTHNVDNTAPVTNVFIQVKSDLGSAADIIKVKNDKGY